MLRTSSRRVSSAEPAASRKASALRSPCTRSHTGQLRADRSPWRSTLAKRLMSMLQLAKNTSPRSASTPGWAVANRRGNGHPSWSGPSALPIDSRQIPRGPIGVCTTRVWASISQGWPASQVASTRGGPPSRAGNTSIAVFSWFRAP